MQISADSTSHLSGWLSSKRQQITSVGKDVEQRESLCPVGGNVNWYSHYAKQCDISSKYRTTMSQQSHFWVYTQRKWNQDLEIFTLPDTEQHPRFGNIPRVHWRMNVKEIMVYIYAVRFFSAIKKKKKSHHLLQQRWAWRTLWQVN